MMERKTLQSKEPGRVHINPLDVLAIYKALKALRAYYTMHIYDKLQQDAKRVAGYRLMNMLFDAVPLASTIQLERNTERKIEALRELLKVTHCIIDAVEYLSSLPAGRGISYDQAAYMFEMTIDIERQDRSLAKALRANDDEGSRNPQPTGQGASSEIVKGGLPSHLEV